MSDQTTQLDPWSAAMNPAIQTNQFGKTYFGLAKVAVSFVTLVKGAGRVPWEPNQLTPEGKPTNKLTGIDIQLVCKSKEGEEYAVDRNYIAEFGDGEWVTVTLPSLKDAGIMGLQDLNGRYVEAELAPTGKTYTNKAGEVKEKTTFKFIRLFKDEAEMEQVRAARFAGDTSNNGSGAAPAPVYSPTQPPAPAPAEVNPEKATALKFLGAYVSNAFKQANGDVLKAQEILAPMIAGQALLAKYFTANSPEVMQMLAEQVPF